jgi:DNA-binding response OmpR family regulator
MVRSFNRGVAMQNCVVIADDDPTIIELVKLLLGMAHYNVVATNDAIAALAMVRAKEPVAVILDVQMPGGNGSLPGGLAALAKIKADPQMNKLPVMMLSGERGTQTVMQAMTSGADDYMVKPFDPDTLLERVARLVKSSTMVWGKSAAAPTWEL